MREHVEQVAKIVRSGLALHGFGDAEVNVSHAVGGDGAVMEVERNNCSIVIRAIPALGVLAWDLGVEARPMTSEDDPADVAREVVRALFRADRKIRDHQEAARMTQGLIDGFNPKPYAPHAKPRTEPVPSWVSDPDAWHRAVDEVEDCLRGAR